MKRSLKSKARITRNALGIVADEVRADAKFPTRDLALLMAAINDLSEESLARLYDIVVENS